MDWSGQGLFSHLHKGLQNIPKVAFKQSKLCAYERVTKEGFGIHDTWSVQGWVHKLRYSGPVMGPS